MPFKNNPYYLSAFSKRRCPGLSAGGFKRQREVKQRRRSRAVSLADCSLKMDLGLLQAQDREIVLEVLRRDKQLRTFEENRIR